MKVKNLLCIVGATLVLSSGIACSSEPSDPSYKEPTAAEKAAKAQRGGSFKAAGPGGSAPATSQTIKPSKPKF